MANYFEQFEDYGKKPNYFEQFADRSGPGMEHGFNNTNRPPRKESKLSDIPGGVRAGLSNITRGALQRYWEAVGDPRAEIIRQDVVDEREAAGRATSSPSLAYSFGEGVGEAVPIGAMSLVAGASVPAAAATGIVSGGLRPSASNEETLSNAALEGIFGLGTSLALRTISPRPKIEPEHLASITAGRRHGMTYTGGQIADNPIVQRAEAHAQWNPLLGTKWHAIGIARQQDDEFIKAMLKQAGVEQSKIPKNPSLSPEVLQSAHDAISSRYDRIFNPSSTFDATASSNPRLWTSLRNLRPNNVNLLEGDKRIVVDAARQIRQTLYNNNGRIPSLLYQDMIELVDEARSRLTADGAKKAGDKLRSLHESLLDGLPDRKAYEAVQGDYARLLTIEDTLVRSRGAGSGIPERGKLLASVERSIPGGVTRNRSTMADLARGGKASVGVGALPDRSTGMPIPSDIPNMMTYWRWNNPIARYGMLNQQGRDIADTLIRYLPGQQASDVVPYIYDNKK